MGSIVAVAFQFLSLEYETCETSYERFLDPVYGLQHSICHTRERERLVRLLKPRQQITFN